MRLLSYYLQAAILRLFAWILPPDVWDWPDDSGSDEE